MQCLMRLNLELDHSFVLTTPGSLAAQLNALPERSLAAMHPMVLGELVCGCAYDTPNPECYSDCDDIPFSPGSGPCYHLP